MDIDKLSFDKLMELLSKSVASLESGELQLEQAMDEYNKGIKIIKILDKKLKDAKQQMQVIKIDE